MSRMIAFLLTLVLALSGAATFTASAADGDGSISGAVTGPSGQPLEGVRVEAFLRVPDSDQIDSMATEWTDASGHYTVGPLPPGTYFVSFQPVGYVEDALPNVVVGAGQAVTDQDIRLAMSGAITGDVTDPAGDPADGVFVDAWRWDPVELYWDRVGFAVTSAGYYTFPSLKPGRYRIAFRPVDLVPEFWDGAATLETATDITVTSGGEVTGIDAHLASGASLSGTITRTSDSQAVAGVDVVAYRRNASTGSWEARAPVQTDASGDYLIRGLGPGTYRLGFEDTGDVYTTMFWPAAASLETATDITIGSTSLTGKDAQVGTAPFPAVTNVAAPAVTGTAQVGLRLTASTGTWAPSAGTTFTYEWLIGSRVVSGATSSTFTPPAGTGRTVRVRVHAAKAGHTTGVATSAATAALAPEAVANTVLPRITGSPLVGKQVTATPGTWRPADALHGYQWLLDGRPITGATSSAYTVRPNDLGRRLSVRVSATKSGWTASAATSSATKVRAGRLDIRVRPKVTGKPRAGAVLKVSPGRWSPAGAKATIQWYAGAKAIRSATTAKLRLAGPVLTSVRAKAISVRVTISAKGYASVVTRLKVRGTVR